MTRHTRAAAIYIAGDEVYFELSVQRRTWLSDVHGAKIKFQDDVRDGSFLRLGDENLLYSRHNGKVVPVYEPHPGSLIGLFIAMDQVLVDVYFATSLLVSLPVRNLANS